MESCILLCFSLRSADMLTTGLQNSEEEHNVEEKKEQRSKG